MFSIDIDKKDGLYLYTLRSEKASAQIIPQLGGMVHKLSLYDSAAGETFPVLEHDSDEELYQNPLYRGRMLFPFNDRVPNGRYNFSGKSYQLPINSPEDNSAIHGLVADKPMKVIKRTNSVNSASLLLKCIIEQGQWEYYPFGVTLYLTYILKDDEFTLDVHIENTGSCDAPVCFGWHPYFILGGTVDQLFLKADSREYIPVDDSLMPTGDICLTKASPYQFAEGLSLKGMELDIAVSTPEDGKIELYGDQGRLEFTWSKDFFEYTQLFIPPGRRSIAIEPITGATDSFNRPVLGLNVVKPEQAIEGLATIRFKDPRV